jgi:hypothetical protein
LSGLVDIPKSSGFGLAARRDARHNVAVQNGHSDGRWWRTKLRKGTVLSRYGPAHGRFAADVGTKFEHRVLPGDVSEWDEYHVELLEDMEVDVSLTAPWFDQPGGAVQYRFEDSISELRRAGRVRIKEIGPCYR